MWTGQQSLCRLGKSIYESVSVSPPSSANICGVCMTMSTSGWPGSGGQTRMGKAVPNGDWGDPQLLVEPSEAARFWNASRDTGQRFPVRDIDLSC